MVKSIGDKYADFLTEFKEYSNTAYKRNIRGYAAVNGINSLVNMEQENYNVALSVFGEIDRVTKNGKNYMVARYPEILCAAFLVNDCLLIKEREINENGIALLAQNLWGSDQRTFDSQLAVLANNDLLDTLQTVFLEPWDRDQACNVIVEHAKEVKALDNDQLKAFWAIEANNMKNNPDKYRLTSETLTKLGLVNMQGIESVRRNATGGQHR